MGLTVLARLFGIWHNSISGVLKRADHSLLLLTREHTQERRRLTPTVDYEKIRAVPPPGGWHLIKLFRSSANVKRDSSMLKLSTIYSSELNISMSLDF